jgi:hypothetical protein
VFQQTAVCPVPDSRPKFGASAEGLRNREDNLAWVTGLGATGPALALKAPPVGPGSCFGRGRVPPCHAAPWAELSASVQWRPATIRSGVSGLSRCSGPQVIQCGLLPRCGKVSPARLVVNQVDDDVPHDRTPLFDPRVIPAIRFPMSSRDHENGFVGAMESLHGLCTTKQLHGFAIPQFGRACPFGAKHNAAKRNIIAWRRCVSMLDAQIPSKALSAEVVPRFDAAQP